MVEKPERILRRGSIKANKGIFHLQKTFSLPIESVKSVESIILDNGTNQSLLRSKYSSELSQVITGPERLNYSKSFQKPSQPSSTSFFPKTKIHKVHTYL